MKSLHLGSGARVIAGWINLDLSPPHDLPAELEQYFVACDLRLGFPPTVRAASAPLIYSEHFFEHLDRHDAVRLLRECHRVLAPGGVIRVSVPGLAKLVEQYAKAAAGDVGALCFASAVGWRPATAAQLLNEGMRMWDHRFMYDARELQLVFREAGFERVIPQTHGTSLTPGMPLEGRPFLGDIVVEATR